MKIKVVDFFSGCGGSSAGFRESGMEILAGIDIDKDSERTFTYNFPKSHFICNDIRKIKATSLDPIIGKHRNYPLLFCACAPCQPFSKQNKQKTNKDNRISLLDELHRFVRRFKPEFIFLENVPGIQKNIATGPLGNFKELLNKLSYSYQDGVIYAQDFGVPQRRRRLVLVASRIGSISIPSKTHGPNTENPKYETVWKCISHLPILKAGQENKKVPNHRAAELSKINLERIKNTPKGGNRSDWPEHLKLNCHKKYSGHTDVYGRMHKNRPASALTTRCISLSNGRFGHPVQNRAISVREAACLQTFSEDFIFFGNLNSMAQQIGNAVPVLLAKRFGEAFIAQVKSEI